MEITSVSNELVKNIVKLQQKKYRQQTGKFLLEGYKAIKEAYECGIEIEHLFVEKSKVGNYNFAKNIFETNSQVLKKISTTETFPEAVAVGKQKEFKLSNYKDLKKIVLLEGIKDGGNLGTIIRSSLAFGADGIILYGDCIDLYNPKVVRAAVGNLWKIPVICVHDLSVLKQNFSKFNRVATLPRSNNLLKSYKFQEPLVIMFGSEADGLSEELVNFSTDSVKIEMDKSVESLNLATSVAVILYSLV